MYCPKIFKDDPIIIEKVITYIAVHGFTCWNIGPAIRILCPDKLTVYHYNKDERVVKNLKDCRGLPPRVMTPHKVEGFMEALCGHILPKHKAHIIYNVCKIPFLSYEKENEEETKALD